MLDESYKHTVYNVDINWRISRLIAPVHKGACYLRLLLGWLTVNKCLNCINVSLCKDHTCTLCIFTTSLQEDSLNEWRKKMFLPVFSLRSAEMPCLVQVTLYVSLLLFIWHSTRKFNRSLSFSQCGKLGIDVILMFGRRQTSITALALWIILDSFDFCW